jgi:hypothetical protein
LAVSVALLPAHIATVAGEIDGVGRRFTFTVLDAVAEQPLISDTVTEKIDVETGLTLILSVVAPVLHEKMVPPLAVSVALAPAQIETVAGEIVAVNASFTVTVLETVAVHP